MVTIAQRIEALRTEKGISRPALAAAVKLPRMSIEKFETGRQTPSQEQQKMLAAYFGVSVSYLKGESDDDDLEVGESTNDSMDGEDFSDEDF